MLIVYFHLEQSIFIKIKSYAGELTHPNISLKEPV